MAHELSAQVCSWEGLLLVILLVVVTFNAISAPGYLDGPEPDQPVPTRVSRRPIVARSVTFVIIAARSTLSVASVMGLAAVVMATLSSQWRADRGSRSSWCCAVGAPLRAPFMRF